MEINFIYFKKILDILLFIVEMCRFTVYKGRSIPIGDIVLFPDYSLAHQSRDASYHPGVIDVKCRRNIRVNGDGFGLGWYSDSPNSPDNGSCLFKLTSPAWSNVNLKNIGTYVESPVLFGHIRAASNDVCFDDRVVISDENCHPFKYGRYTFMHNGFIPNFLKVKRALCMDFDDDIYRNILGSTDSEHIFGLFLSNLPDRLNPLSHEVLAETLDLTITKLSELCAKAGIFEPCSLNIAVTDGVNVIATRFRNGSQEPPSLYYSFGSRFNVDEGNFENQDPEKASEIIISSAPLNRNSGGDSEGEEATFLKWKLIPKDHMLICVGDPRNLSRVKSIELRPITAPGTMVLETASTAGSSCKLAALVEEVFSNQRPSSAPSSLASKKHKLAQRKQKLRLNFIWPFRQSSS